MVWRSLLARLRGSRSRYRRFVGTPSDVEVFDRDPYTVMRLMTEQTLVQGKQHRINKLDFGLNYLQQHMLAALLVPNPKRILVLGLGVGALPRLLSAIFSAVEITVVELNPGIVKAARECFQFQESEGITLHLADASEWIRTYTGHKFDLIYNDCFDGLVTSVQTRTNDTTQQLFELVSASGVLVINRLRQEYHASLVPHADEHIPPPLCWPANGKTNLTLIHMAQQICWNHLNTRAQSVDHMGVLPFSLTQEVQRLHQLA